MKSQHHPALLSTAAAVCAAFAVAGCAVGPDYLRPSVTTPPNYKEAPAGWVNAAPADLLDRGIWWSLFDDPVLNDLALQVEVSNQNVAAATAQYAQARALVREQRAALWPVVNLTGGATRSGSGAGSNGTSGAGSRTGTNYQIGLGASWEPDVWGRLGRAVTGAQASAQASAADLAAAKLSAQGELVTNYLSLRLADAQFASLNTTVTGYQRVLQITQNRYNAGIAAKTDLLQAQTQLTNAQADLLTQTRQRAVLEHAIAVLIGKAPAEFSQPVSPEWKVVVPEVPVGVPSTLLQRRPDIAAAERRVAAANEQIGIAQSAYYPNLSLSASYGFGASKLGELFRASSNTWSLGLSAAQTLFNAGLTGARVEGAEASQQEAVARYRQTVLTAFQDVEDQLTATRVLAQQQELRRQSSAAADQVEQQVLNRYNAGQVGFSDVVTAQVTAQNARRALLQVQADRQTAAVALIQALGGGWQADYSATTTSSAR